MRAEAKEVKVCTNKECKRGGSKKTLAMFEALGLEGVEIVEIRCLDECGMGPNVQINGDDGPIINGVKTEDDVKKVVDRLMESGEVGWEDGNAAHLDPAATFQSSVN